MARFCGIMAVCLWASPVWAMQATGKSPIATVTASVQPGTVAPGTSGVMNVVVTVAPQFHINTHLPNDPSLIATTFTSVKTPGVIFGKAQFPPAQQMKAANVQMPLAVYHGQIVIIVPFTLTKTARAGRLMLRGLLYYQGCSETGCYLPTTVPVQAVVSVR